MTEIWQLFGGLFIALIFASTVGYVLKRRSGVDTPNSVIDNLNARINEIGRASCRERVCLYV